MTKVPFDDENFIYESPDQGNTLYRRHIGTMERELVRREPSNLFTYTAFREIKELSETNTSIRKALDNLLLIYYTIKDDENTS